MRFRLSKPAAVITCIFLAFAAIYAIYVHRQDANLFFEANFIHAAFLRDILDRHLTARAFFTVYGEHLFPGFNLILALNLLLFRIWGGFDSIVYGTFLIATAALVAQRIWTTAPWQHRTAGVAFVSLLLMSTTNNPQWGMALAATVGVFLFVWIARIVNEALWGSGKINPLFFVLIPVAQILFLGGYAIGAIASIGAAILVHSIQNRKIALKSVVIGATVAVTLAVYVAIVSHYSSLTSAHPTSLDHNIWAILKFAAVMTGASMMGKAMPEQTGAMWAVIVVGAFLIVMTVVFWIDALRRPTKAGMFVFALSVYSATNIVVVALFRYRNGLDGAMGQWYNAHTHFVAVGVAYFLFTKIKGRDLSSALPAVCVIALLGFELAAYSEDWKKAPYAADYKEHYIAQAPIVLAFPELIKDKAEPTQTMLWDYGTVKPAVDMLYQHHLWIFNFDGAKTEGLTHDGWIEAGRPAVVMCPGGTRSIDLWLWRDDKWPTATVKVRSNAILTEIPASGIASIDAANGIAAFMIDAGDENLSKPQSPNGDQRKLVAKLAGVICK